MSKGRERPDNKKSDRLSENLDDFDLMERDAKAKIADSGRAAVGKTLKLEYPQDKDPEYYYFWAVNTDKTVTDIQSLLERGFEFDRYTNGKNRGQKIVKNVRGVNHYGMRQPIELHKEDLRKTSDILKGQNQKVNHIGEREYGALKPGQETESAIQRELVENPDILSLT